ncbi:MAG: cob(I)yrinic acid a,c-diamide adenosyltransferase [Balneolaceae bacterium]
MKIYTKTGDTGETSLYGGTRVPKNELRIEAYGTVDELNSLLGHCLSHSPADRICGILNAIQQQLFRVGADLATPEDAKARIERVDESVILELESHIDELQEQLPPLKHFILPGGSTTGATIHLARTVCRRAERIVVSCHSREPVNPMIITYLNRLSDLLFVMARYENQQQNEPETPWIPDRKK